MQGQVYDDSNSPLPGATVLAIHQPSGSQYATITNAEGRFQPSRVCAQAVRTK
jgi:hypothetical protein